MKYMIGRAEAEEEGEASSSSSNRQGMLTAKDDEIIISIDPMEGAREFVKGGIQNILCRIGITVNGVPVAGAMGLHMVHGNKIDIAYGMISRTNEGAVVP